jgi:asparagine synthase (glutamine-hydrolysing)
MCGIAGFIDNKITNPKEVLEQMLQATKHRGPDDRGTWINNEVALGHNRLSIIDLSPAGHQPMTSQCGNYTIVFNGEVYNYKELQEKLPQGLKLKSSTDTEVVLELWVIYGKAILSELRGMFAFAIWDEREHTLTLARDHMGIKPLYYYFENERLFFCSEIKGLLASGYVPKEINDGVIEQYLYIGYVNQPNTFIKNVWMLPPASHLTFDLNKITIRDYWSITQTSNNCPANEADAISQIKSLVIDAVTEETISDRPLGIFLSGGLDSTVILAALKQGGIKNINTFSVGFKNDKLSEFEDVKQTAEFYQTNHFQLEATENDVLPYIEEYINSLDQPSVDGLNTWLVSKITKKHVTVALSGLGGDELFSGYSIDREIIQQQRNLFRNKLISITEPIWRNAPRSILNRLISYKNWANITHHYSAWGKVFLTDDIAKLTSRNEQRFPSFNKGMDIGKHYDLLQRITFMQLRGFMMSRLLRDSDAVSMHHSLEVRFPLIDSRLVNLVFNMPMKWRIKPESVNMKLKNYEQSNSYEHNKLKYLIYKAFEKDLPPSFGKRPKRGFKLPMEKWMQSHLHHELENTLTKNNTYLNSAAVNKIWEEWLKGKVGWSKIWVIYTLEKWVQQNIR